MTINLETNPLRLGLARETVVDPCIMVILGGTGDLAHRKLLPALYHLQLGGFLPRDFAIIGFASSDTSEAQYRQSIQDWIKKISPHLAVGGHAWEEFSSRIHYCRRTGDMLASIRKLKQDIDEINSKVNAEGNCLFYLAIPPFLFAEYAQMLGQVGLSHDENGNGWRRIVVEKPFGEDLASAKKLNQALVEYFSEDQIYRIDHYLGKETVQNIQVFRFANNLIEPILNSNYVDHIQITVAEEIGVEGRGGYYDSAGALRDMVQNHLLQIVSLLCMDAPSSLDPKPVRDEKAKVINSVRRFDPEDVGLYAVRGQYVEGKLIGRDVPGYLQEENVSPESVTETYVALKLLIDNDRWRDTPVYLRTGKRLAKRVTEVSIHLKLPPHNLFEKNGGDHLTPNVIAIEIQPNEGIAVRFEAKIPGLSFDLQSVHMDFRYGSAFGASVPEAYERLLLDALLGDQSLFPRADWVETAWAIVDPVMECWQRFEAPLYHYVPGSWGPMEAIDFIAHDGRQWRRL